MKFIVSGKNIDVTDALRERSMKKVGKLEKFFQPDTEAHITLSVEKNKHIIEVTIPFNSIMLRAEVSSDDMYASMDKAVDIIEKQIIKYKTRLEKRIHQEASTAADVAEPSEPEMEEEEEFRVVRTKRFAIKPMPVEEAILQMNLLNHEFFMFQNAETNQVNVVYKRKRGDYGLIEPEF